MFYSDRHIFESDKHNGKHAEILRELEILRKMREDAEACQRRESEDEWNYRMTHKGGKRGY